MLILQLVALRPPQCSTVEILLMGLGLTSAQKQTLGLMLPGSRKIHGINMILGARLDENRWSFILFGLERPMWLKNAVILNQLQHMLSCFAMVIGACCLEVTAEVAEVPQTMKVVLDERHGQKTRSQSSPSRLMNS